MIEITNSNNNNKMIEIIKHNFYDDIFPGQELYLHSSFCCASDSRSYMVAIIFIINIVFFIIGVLIYYYYYYYGFYFYCFH